MARKNSTSSMGSAAGSLQSSSHAPGKRPGSSGSMTERTLRTPSPNRSSIIPRQPQQVPPIPPVPNTSATVRPRASSTDRPLRTFSPTIVGGNARGASLDDGARPLPQQKQPLSQVQELSRENSRRLINYSRPISPQNSLQTDAQSPDLPPALLFRRKQQSGWFTGGVISGQQPRGSNTTNNIPVASTFQSGHSPSSAITTYKSDTVPTEPKPIDPPRSRAVAPVGLAASRWRSPYMHAGTEPFDPHIDDHFLESRPEHKMVPQVPHELSPAQQFVTPQLPSELPSQHAIAPPKPETTVAQSTVTPHHQQLKAAQPENIVSKSPSSPILTDAVLPPPSTQNQNTIREPIHAPVPQQPMHYLESPLVSFVPQEPTKVPERPISPSKATKISPDPPNTVINGLRHEPLGRTASPVKSALKQSGRNQSPVAVVVVPETESAPQPADVAKRKKSVRIKVDVRPGDDLDVRSSRYAPPTPMRPAHPVHDVDFEEDLDDIMKPTPVLPSFGSIRTQSKDTAEDRSGPSTPRQNPQLEDHMSSSDHAISGILRQSPLAGKGARREDTDSTKPSSHIPSDPLPPEVTSVEGTGFDSDEGGSVGIPEPLPPPSEKKGEITETKPDQIQAYPPAETPKVALQALERPVESQKEKLAAESDKDELHIPGAFPEEIDDRPQDINVPKNKVMFAPAPEVDSDSSSDDDSSIYSDAEEELEGTGFASLDAVLEESSPIAVAAASKSFQESNDHSSSRADNPDLEKRLAEAQKNREDQERAAVVPPPQEQTLEVREQTKPEETKAIDTPEVKSTTMTEQTKQTELNSSKWSPAGKFHSAVGHLKSLRRNPAQSPSRAPPTKATSPVRRPASSLQPAPILRRTHSNDSVSSFKRQRASPPPNGRITLRSSLRSDPQRTRSPPRTLSPSESIGSRQHAMRTSLRGSSPSMTHESDSLKRSRISSLIKSSKSAASKVVPSSHTSQSSKFESRFAHDSDSDGERSPAVRKPYISRFAKNSDENLPLSSSPPQKGLPVFTLRGIPRKSQVDDDVQSTDLEDESESPKRSPLPPVPSIDAVNRAHSNRNPELPNGAKGSLDTSRFAPQATSASQAQSPHRRWHSAFLFGSSSPPSAGRGASPPPSGSRKLRRRGTDRPMSRAIDATTPSGWPLPEAPKNADMSEIDTGLKRPGSSDGAGQRQRIDLGERRNTTDAVLELKTLAAQAATRNQSSEEATPTLTVLEDQFQNTAIKPSRFSKWKKRMKLG
jgi:serine/arginine repetitive matrix protein 2